MRQKPPKEEVLSDMAASLYHHLTTVASQKSELCEVAKTVAVVAADIADKRPLVWKYVDEHNPRQFMTAVEEAYEIALAAAARGIDDLKPLVSIYIEDRLKGGSKWLNSFKKKKFVGTDKTVYTGQALMEAVGMELDKIRAFPRHLEISMPEASEAMNEAIEALRQSKEKRRAQRAAAESKPETSPAGEKWAEAEEGPDNDNPYKRRITKKRPGGGLSGGAGI